MIRTSAAGYRGEPVEIVVGIRFAVRTVEYIGLARDIIVLVIRVRITVEHRAGGIGPLLTGNAAETIFHHRGIKGRRGVVISRICAFCSADDGNSASDSSLSALDQLVINRKHQLVPLPHRHFTSLPKSITNAYSSGSTNPATSTIN